MQALRRNHPHRDRGRGLSFALAALALAGCGTAVVPAGTEQAAFIAQGARPVPQEARADLLVGHRLVGDGFSVYYAPDGTKRIRTDTGVVVERRWWIGDEGAFCEELAASGAPVCGGAGRLYVDDGRYRAFRPDGSAAGPSFRIEEGPSDGVGHETVTGAS